MNIIKRNGVEALFDPIKITNALKAANTSVEDNEQLSDNEIEDITKYINDFITKSTYTHNVEDIQDLVEEQIFKRGKFKLSKNYITYRYQHQLNRENNSFLDKVSSIINHNNSEIEEENANKNPTIISTQRDYVAGEVSKWYAKERLFDKDLIDAHEEGIIHIHDMDYLSMKLYNCCLINMDDMLQNGTIISGSYISKPKSFTTACNVATQIMAQVASSQLGGQTTNVYHLSKFVDVSRQKFIQQEKERLEKYNITLDKETFDKIIEELVAEEVKKGVQMIQYQINTLQTTNGQSPFASLFIYFNEAKEGQDREDLVLVTKEILKQRIRGIQNKVGAWIAPPFPKILYVLDSSNCDESTPYWEVTKLAAECTAKRMVPDYISEKVMKELKDGNVYGCMGAVTEESKVKYKIHEEIYIESISSMYNRIVNRYGIKEEDQFGQEGNPNKDLNLKDLDVTIFDNNANAFVKCEMMNKNIAKDFKIYKLTAKIDLTDREYTLTMTHDHPLMVCDEIKNMSKINLVETQCKNIKVGQYVLVTPNDKSYFDSIFAKITNIEEIENKYEYVYDVTTETGKFMVNNILSHNCRSFLSVWKDPENDYKPKFWGRFNKQVCTVNLPDVALTIRDKYGENAISNPEAMKEFWSLLDERLELCHRVLLTRCHYLEGTISDVAPILWQAGAIARLKPGEKIDKLLKDGYSTTSLGYVGLYETIMALTGKPHTDPENKEVSLSIIKYMKEMCDKWNAIPNENYGFSLYGTPEESTTYKFAKALQKRHGIINKITDKLYVMNSYHVDVKEQIDAFSKLDFESDFQKYTNGGAISYVETSNLQNNLEAVLTLIKHIYNHIWYAELNCKLDYCMKCGYDGEISIVEDDNKKLVWECPNCKNRDLKYMNVVRRVCGYMSNANHTCNGRMHEFRDRWVHI